MCIGHCIFYSLRWHGRGSGGCGRQSNGTSSVGLSWIYWIFSPSLAECRVTNEKFIIVTLQIKYGVLCQRSARANSRSAAGTYRGRAAELSGGKEGSADRLRLVWKLMYSERASGVHRFVAYVGRSTPCAAVRRVDACFLQHFCSHRKF